MVPGLNHVLSFFCRLTGSFLVVSLSRCHFGGAGSDAMAGAGAGVGAGP